jgi:hypothetical protein
LILRGVTGRLLRKSGQPNKVPLASKTSTDSAGACFAVPGFHLTMRPSTNPFLYQFVTMTASDVLDARRHRACAAQRTWAAVLAATLALLRKVGVHGPTSEPFCTDPIVSWSYVVRDRHVNSMSGFERLLVRGCAELPAYRCGQEMQIASLDQLPGRSDAYVGVRP